MTAALSIEQRIALVRGDLERLATARVAFVMAPARAAAREDLVAAMRDLASQSEDIAALLDRLEAVERELALRSGKGAA